MKETRSFGKRVLKQHCDQASLRGLLLLPLHISPILGAHFHPEPFERDRWAPWGQQWPSEAAGRVGPGQGLSNRFASRLEPNRAVLCFGGAQREASPRKEQEGSCPDKAAFGIGLKKGNLLFSAHSESCARLQEFTRKANILVYRFSGKFSG